MISIHNEDGKMKEFILDKSFYTLSNFHQVQNRTPYPFQKKAFEALDRLKTSNPNGFSSMLVLPTGGGKTYTAAHWILKNYINHDVKVLWIAHRSELLRQAAEAFFCDTTMETLPSKNSYISYVVSSEFGRSCNVPKANPDLLIASRQSLCSGSNMDYILKWAKGRGLKKDRKLLIVLDEAHHAAAASYRTIIASMKKYIPHVDVLGLTATPFRTARNERGSLKSIFSTGSGIAYSIDMNTLISAGILATPRHIEISTNVDMTDVFDEEELYKISRNDLTSLDEKSLQKLNQNTNRNKLIVDTYLANRKKFGQTIVFAVDVLNAIAINAIFQAAGVRSDFVVSTVAEGMTRSVSVQRNAQIIRDFKEGKLEVLVNVNIVTEGTDIPNIQTVFLARPTTSKVLMTQMIGRGLRGEAAGGTKETQIVYFVDEWKGLIDFVSPKELLEGTDTLTAHKESKKELLKYYIHVQDVADYAVSMYNSRPYSITRFNNIIPYGIIKCSYISTDEYDEETEISRDILVFDEAVDAYQKILAELQILFADMTKEYSMQDIKVQSINLFFKYCECKQEAVIGISSRAIQDIILTFLSTQELPVIYKIEDRVSLIDIVQQNYVEDMNELEIDNVIQNVWEHNAKVRSWYEKDFYYGMMRVYFNRMNTASIRAPEFKLPPKEQMDMGEIRKHYPEYFEELRQYLILGMKKDEEGYYYSAIQEEGKPPIRFKNLSAFEMDHIIPISKGGLTIKENLQMITRKQNRDKGNKII